MLPLAHPLDLPVAVLGIRLTLQLLLPSRYPRAFSWLLRALGLCKAGLAGALILQQGTSAQLWLAIGATLLLLAISSTQVDQFEPHPNTKSLLPAKVVGVALLGLHSDPSLQWVVLGLMALDSLKASSIFRGACLWASLFCSADLLLSYSKTLQSLLLYSSVVALLQCLLLWRVTRTGEAPAFQPQFSVRVTAALWVGFIFSGFASCIIVDQWQQLPLLICLLASTSFGISPYNSNAKKCLLPPVLLCLTKVSQYSLPGQAVVLTSSVLLIVFLEGGTCNPPEFESNVTFQRVLLSIALAYCYIIALALLFYVALSVINLYHALLTLFGITTLAVGGRRLWTLLTALVALMLALRSGYRHLGLSFDSGLLGLQMQYSPPPWQDGPLFLLLLACTLQTQVYQSQLFSITEDQHSLNYLIMNHALLRQNTILLRAFIRKLKSIFQALAVWLAYFVLLLLLVVRPSSLTSTVPAILILALSIYHFTFLVLSQNPRKEWVLAHSLVLVLGLCTLLKYIYLFTVFREVRAILPGSVLDFLRQNQQFLGLRTEQPQFYLDGVILAAALVLRSYHSDKTSWEQPLLSRRRPIPSLTDKILKFLAKNYSQFQFSVVVILCLVAGSTPALFVYLFILALYNYSVHQEDSKCDPELLQRARRRKRRTKLCFLFFYMVAVLTILHFRDLLNWDSFAGGGNQIAVIFPHLVVGGLCIGDLKRLRILQAQSDEDQLTAPSDQKLEQQGAQAISTIKQFIRELTFLVTLIYVYIVDFSLQSCLQLGLFTALMVFRLIDLTNLVLVLFSGFNFWLGGSQGNLIFLPLVLVHFLTNLHFKVDSTVGHLGKLTIRSHAYAKLAVNNLAFFCSSFFLFVFHQDMSLLNLLLFLTTLVYFYLSQLGTQPIHCSSDIPSRVAQRFRVYTWYFSLIGVVNFCFLIVTFIAKSGAIKFNEKLEHTLTRIVVVFLCRVCTVLFRNQFSIDTAEAALKKSHFKSKVVSLLIQNKANDERIQKLLEREKVKHKIAKQLAQIESKFDLNSLTKVSDTFGGKRLVRKQSLSIAQQQQEGLLERLGKLLGVQNHMVNTVSYDCLKAQLLERHPVALWFIQDLQISDDNCQILWQVSRLTQWFYQEVERLCVWRLECKSFEEAVGLVKSSERYCEFLGSAKQRQDHEKEEEARPSKLQWVASNWDLICFVAVGFFQVNSSGLLSVPLSVLVLAYGVSLARKTSRRMWVLGFWYVSWLIVCKFVLHIHLMGQIDYRLLYTFYGEEQQSTTQILLLLMFLVQIKLVKQYGTFYDSLAAKESFRTACLRRALAKGVFRFQELDEAFKRHYQQMGQSPSFLQPFLNTEAKAGRDLYPLIGATQVLILLFLFLFFNKMMDLSSFISTDSSLSNSFSPRVLVALFLHCLVMVADRALHTLTLQPARLATLLPLLTGALPPQGYQQVKPKIQWPLLLKYLLNLALLILVTLFVFFYVPSTRKGSCQQDCRAIFNNPYLKIFYLLFWVYFFFNALQIRFGLPYQKGTAWMFKREPGYVTYYFYKILRAIPFLWQIKKFFDWSIIPTSLTLWQWLKLEQLYCLMFQAKNLSHFLKGKPAGTMNAWYVRFAGALIAVSILVLLIGPVLLYSQLNPFLAQNPPISASSTIFFRSDKGRFQLFSNSHVRQIRKSEEGQQGRSGTLYLIQMQQFSDGKWTLSQPAKQDIKRSLRTSAGCLLEIQLQIKRKHSYEAAKITLPRSLSTEQSNELLHLIQNGEGELALNYSLPNQLRLGDRESFSIVDTGKAYSELVLRIFRKEGLEGTYWSAGGLQGQGLSFLVVAQKFSPALFNYSVQGFYISFVLVIASLLRFYTTINLQAVRLRDIPQPQAVLSLCEGVMLARSSGQLVQEELLYFYLIDLFRNPSLALSITNSYTHFRSQ